MYSCVAADADPGLPALLFRVRVCVDAIHRTSHVTPQVSQVPVVDEGGSGSRAGDVMVEGGSKDAARRLVHARYDLYVTRGSGERRNRAYRRRGGRGCGCRRKREVPAGLYISGIILMRNPGSRETLPDKEILRQPWESFNEKPTYGKCRMHAELKNAVIINAKCST
jgi:hypothetical protein